MSKQAYKIGDTFWCTASSDEVTGGLEIEENVWDDEQTALERAAFAVKHNWPDAAVLVIECTVRHKCRMGPPMWESKEETP